ncbi:tail needle protein [Arthrobacter phage BaileyBlu]|uniref:Tail needle protein n=1 Tax=Arthrobacter phage BaileyBlu TaxID=2910754 RepID=A0AA49BPY2_9CAUD|nr:tail needle protein [Arthrobacter phage BaileyBlu]UJQ87158.1 tail needle protein [Arthrobacter phage BaileyBlu]
MNEHEAHMSTSSESAQMLVALTRMEAKMDVGFARIGAVTDKHAASIDDHEERIRTLEQKPTVSPRTLWTTITAGGGLLVALMTIAEKLLGG